MQWEVTFKAYVTTLGWPFANFQSQSFRLNGRLAKDHLFAIGRVLNESALQSFNLS